MTFDELDEKMRQYEQSLDQFITEGNYIIVRLDGKAFTNFTKNIMKFEAPFDVKFRDLMVDTTKYLVENSGFRIEYGYTESDEISLLFNYNDNTYGRKVRKIITELAGTCSAYFSREVYKRFNKDLNKVPNFDARVCPLPNENLVKDYFSWRQEDSHRNSLNAWCYWILRKDNLNARRASKELEKQNNSYKNELLFQYGINYNDLPNWQKRGVGVAKTTYQKEGFNPLTKETVIVTRHKVDCNYDLPVGEEYHKYIEQFITH